ncbi:MAG: DUF4293 domain-containing protein [Cyclobacteriaceae bacterium]
MIQRIQSIFLVLVIASLVSSVFFVFWVKSDETSQEAVNLYAQEMVKLKIVDGEQKEVAQSEHIYLFILPLLIAGIAAYSLFQFNNRMRQMQLGALNSLLLAVNLGLLIWRTTAMDDMIATTTYDFPAFGFYSLIGAMIFNLSANRFIRRDEKLVKSMDRIR